MKLAITQGDACLEMQRRITEMGAYWCDATVTSPPYNIGIKYADNVNDSVAESVYLSWCREWLKLLLLSTRRDGHLFLNVGALSKCPLRPFQLVTLAAEVGWQLQNTFHWIKSFTFEDKNGKPVSQGQFKPINSNRYVNKLHEYVFHLTPEGTSVLDRLAIGVPYQDKSNVERWDTKADRRCRGDVWFIPYATIQNAEKERPHPATFPVALAEQCLKIAGRPPVVLDPFMGSGSTGVAAVNCGAKLCMGFDLSETYATAAETRIIEHAQSR